MATLESVPLDEIASYLGKLANNKNFSCGGSEPAFGAVDIVYKKGTGEWAAKPLHLPGGLTEENVQDFLDSCSPASSGSGNECHELEAESFGTNFELANTSIIHSLTRMMNTSPIRAELNKLSVFSKGGHLKAHADRPHLDKDKFGSLVVCLPSDFQGGQLITRCRESELRFDWSSSVTTYWAAFSSDVEYEVLPIATGYLLTLTYNLCYSLPTVNVLSPNFTTNSLYKGLLSALQNPQFMREGGTLGFYCQHRYSNISSFLEQMDFCLKGEDIVVYRVAKALQLSVSLKPLLFKKFINDFDENDYEMKLEDMRAVDSDSDEKSYYFLHEFAQHKIGADESTLPELYNTLRKEFADPERVSGIKWCQSPEVFEPIFASYVRDHNEGIYALYSYYQCPVFLVEVPKYTSQRGSIQIPQ